jgi:hypothetical protein
MSLSRVLWKVHSKDHAMAASSSGRHAGDDHDDRVTPLSGTQLSDDEVPPTGHRSRTSTTVRTPSSPRPEPSNRVSTEPGRFILSSGCRPSPDGTLPPARAQGAATKRYRQFRFRTVALAEQLRWAGCISDPGAAEYVLGAVQRSAARHDRLVSLVHLSRVVGRRLATTWR